MDGTCESFESTSADVLKITSKYFENLHLLSLLCANQNPQNLRTLTKRAKGSFFETILRSLERTNTFFDKCRKVAKILCMGF